MLFNVFIVLGAVSLLGGFANCQVASSNQNEQLMNLLMSMMSNGAGATKNTNDNQILQLLLPIAADAMKPAPKQDENQLMQMLTNMMNTATKDSAKSNENEAMQLLFLNMLSGNNAIDSAKATENQIMQMLTNMMNMGNKDAAKTNENQLMQLLMNMMGGAKEPAKTNDNQVMQLLMNMMNMGNKDAAKTNDNQLMQLLMNMMNMANKDTAKTNENQVMQLLLAVMNNGADAAAKKPSDCMAAQNMDKNAESELAAWTKMMKADGFKQLFGNVDDYKKFTEMIEYVESSKNDWLSVFLKQMTGNDWLMKMCDQIVSMVESDDEMKESLVKFIKGNKNTYQFTVKAIDWMKMQKFNESTDLIQKIVKIFMDMDLKDAKMDEAWFENFMSWIDCTFAKDSEMASVMKTIGMLAKGDDMLMPFLKKLMDNGKDNTPRMITVQLKLFFKGDAKCATNYTVAPQSLLNIFTLAAATDKFCTTKTVSTTQRMSEQTGKMAIFMGALGVTVNAGTFKWKVQIWRNDVMIMKDADVNFVPMEGDVLYCTFTDK